MTLLTPTQPAVARDPASRHVTADEFERMPDTGGLELIDGVITERNMGVESNLIAGLIYILLHDFATQHKVGTAFPSDTPYQCFGTDRDRVRKADASFIAADRLREHGVPSGFFRIAPDLAVEVVSPGDLAEEVATKTAEYLAAGVKEMWVVSPATRTIQMHRPGRPIEVFGEKDTLRGSDVLPAFEMEVARCFPTPVR